MSYGFKSLFHRFKWIVCALILAPALFIGLTRLTQRDYYAYDLLFGDNVQWASGIVYQMEEGDKPLPNDDAWLSEHPSRLGRWWLKARIDLPVQAPYEDPGLFVSVTGSYELYWDGKLLARNGTLGNNKKEEAAGRFIRVIPIPKEMANPGEHRILMHVSNYHLQRPWLQPVMLLSGELTDLVRNPMRMTALIYTLAGLFLLASGYFLVVYLIGEHRPSFLLFSLTGLALFLLAVMEFIKYCFDFSYSFHFIRLEIIYALTTLIAVLLPLFCAYHFALKHRFALMITLLSTAVIVRLLELDYDTAALWIMLIGLMMAFGLSGRALSRQKPGSLEVFLGIGSCFLLVLAYDLTLFLGFGLLMIAMIISMARAMHRQRRSHEEARLRGSRLEATLLKKQLQPHFLMNTLSSLIAWVEDQPAQGVRFIEALAEELSLLNKVSAEPTIPIEQEVALCRAHLRVMEFRNEVSYRLSWTGCEHERVPPALFHTLLENGLTHLTPNESHMDFRLEGLEKPGITVYLFTAAGRQRKQGKTALDGTGLKYIKSRLQESFPNRWRLQHGPILNGQESIGWQTEIKISTRVVGETK